jgi:hypothetical protein
MADSYNCRPSDILSLKGEYERYCFDEACYYIKYMMSVEKKTPKFANSNINSANDALKSGT